MSRLWFGNFDFEAELCGRTTSGTPRQADAVRDSLLSACWIPHLHPGDQIWLSHPWPTEFLEQLTATSGIAIDSKTICLHPSQISQNATRELAPWGWSEAAQLWAIRNGLRATSPPLSVVRRGNSRSFSVECEERWQCGLVGTRICHSLDDVQSALAKINAAQGDRDRQLPSWVIKAEFSHAARERILGTGREPSSEQVAWLKKRIGRDHCVAVEPWVERVAEVGVQWDIPQIGEPRCLGITPLWTDARGGYRGSGVTRPSVEPANEWRTAITMGYRVAEHLQSEGYFGPLGIDAMRYRTADGERIRPLQDINARWTMGRMALSWGNRILQPSEQGVWVHGPSQSPLNSFPFGMNFSQLLRRVPTSPSVSFGGPQQFQSEFLVFEDLANSDFNCSR